MQWFKHSSYSATEPELKKLIIKYGMEGYGLYWYCIELIAGSVSSRKLNFELIHDAEIIAHDTGIHPEIVQEMMSYMIKLELFQESEGVISCIRLARTLDKRHTRSEELKNVISLSEDSLKTNTRQLPLDKIRRDKKRIDKDKKKQGGIERFSKPTKTELQNYIAEINSSINTNEFLDYYESVGWVVGKGKKMKSWKACVRTWDRNRQSNDEPIKKNFITRESHKEFD